MAGRRVIRGESLVDRRALDGALREAGRAIAANAAGLTAPPHLPVEVVKQDGLVRVLNTSPNAALEEWGSATVEPRAPLRRGVRAAGIRLDEAP